MKIYNIYKNGCLIEVCKGKLTLYQAFEKIDRELMQCDDFDWSAGFNLKSKSGHLYTAGEVGKPCEDTRYNLFQYKALQTLYGDKS